MDTGAKTMANPLFRPHGSTQVEVSDATLIVHMHGHWNTEMRSQTALEMLQHAPGLNAAGPWGIINLLHDTLVYSEAVYANTRQDYADRPASSLLRAVAFVIEPGVEGALLLRPRFETLLRGVIESQVFADLASAKTWMRQQLQPS
jgi:hypothetical protein